MLRSRLLLLIVAASLGLAGFAQAQVTREEFEALKSEVGTLKESVKTQNDLLRQFLERINAARGEREAHRNG